VLEELGNARNLGCSNRTNDPPFQGFRPAMFGFRSR
jgi:hypothetical protein